MSATPHTATNSFRNDWIQSNFPSLIQQPDGYGPLEESHSIISYVANASILKPLFRYTFDIVLVLY
jgi:hypothetical protein